MVKIVDLTIAVESYMIEMFKGIKCLNVCTFLAEVMSEKDE